MYTWQYTVVVKILLDSPMLRRVGPQGMHENPILFTAVILKVYLVPAVSLGTFIDVMVGSVFMADTGVLSRLPSSNV